MKTIIKDEKIKRVENRQAESYIKMGWAYCPKSVWKESKGNKVIQEKKVKSKKTKKT